MGEKKIERDLTEAYGKIKVEAEGVNKAVDEALKYMADVVEAFKRATEQGYENLMREIQKWRDKYL